MCEAASLVRVLPKSGPLEGRWYDMPINQADARQLSRVMLMAYGEDYDVVSMILKPLRVEYPTINWIAELTTVATAWQPFIDSGLSVQWWLNEVDRRSQP